MDLLGAVTEGLSDLVAHGGQLHLRAGQASAGLVVGEALAGEPLSDEHVFNVYCAAKPVTVMATLAALESAGVETGPAVSLAELLEVPPTSPLGSLSFGELLGNRVGLAEPDLFQFLTASDDARAAMLARLDRTLPRRGRRPERSSLALAHVLGTMVRRWVGASLTEAIEAHLDAVGLSRTFVRVPEGTAPIGVYVDRRGGRYLPLLHDRLAHVAESPYAELVGLYTTAEDLGRWATVLGAVVRGDEQPGFPAPSTVRAHLRRAGAPAVVAEPASASGASLTDGQAPPVPDDVVRPATWHFAAGLAVALPAHGLRRATASSMGQVGFVRSSLLYLDPVADVVLVGIHCDLALDDLDGRLASWDHAIGRLHAAAEAAPAQGSSAR